MDITYYKTLFSATGILPGHASGVIRGCEALGTMKPAEDLIPPGEGTVRRPQLCKHHAVRELELSSMVNTCESLQRRHENKPKMLTGLNQKGTWPGTGALNSTVADVAPPA